MIRGPVDSGDQLIQYFGDNKLPEESVMIGENPIDKIADNVKEIAMEIFS